MISLLATALGVLCFPLTASTAPAESMIEARKPDHWGTVAWGNISNRACDHTGGDNEFIAAVSPLLFDNEHPCGRTMVVTYGKNSAVVKVVDRCADCTDNDLVLSPAAFQTLIGRGGLDIENAALINATWDFQPST
ncbi:Non-catalytic module family expansin [Trichoderma ceciliae]